MSEANRAIQPHASNIFADLDVPDAEMELSRVRLVATLQRVIRERKLTQRAAAELLGTSQPRVSRLMKGHLDDFSVECLERYLDALGYRVNVVVVPKAAAPAD